MLRVATTACAARSFARSRRISINSFAAGTFPSATSFTSAFLSAGICNSASSPTSRSRTTITSTSAIAASARAGSTCASRSRAFPTSPSIHLPIPNCLPQAPDCLQIGRAGNASCRGIALLSPSLQLLLAGPPTAEGVRKEIRRAHALPRSLFSVFELSIANRPEIFRNAAPTFSRTLAFIGACAPLPLHARGPAQALPAPAPATATHCVRCAPHAPGRAPEDQRE